MLERSRKQGKWTPKCGLQNEIACGDYCFGRGAQRAFAARRAICWRFLAESFAALAGPPFLPPKRPRATAAGFFSPVASRMTRKAVSFTSSGRLRLLERLGIALV